MRTIDQMVQQEILCCMSSIVSTLARGNTFDPDCQNEAELRALAEQAAELCYPIPDYEEAAIQAGWEPYTDKFGVACWRNDNDGNELTWAGTAEDLCQNHDIEPYDREVYEHWAVTEWFAEKLEAAGEKVDKDFGNLCIWARTTTGQGIASDGVVERIYADMMKPVEA